MDWTHAIVKQDKKVDADSNYAPEVTVFVFGSEAHAASFRHANRGIVGDKIIMKRGDERIPAFGADGVQYERHNF